MSKLQSLIDQVMDMVKNRPGGENDILKREVGGSSPSWYGGNKDEEEYWKTKRLKDAELAKQELVNRGELAKQESANIPLKMESTNRFNATNYKTAIDYYAAQKKQPWDAFGAWQLSHPESTLEDQGKTAEFLGLRPPKTPPVPGASFKLDDGKDVSSDVIPPEIAQAQKGFEVKHPLIDRWINAVGEQGSAESGVAPTPAFPESPVDFWSKRKKRADEEKIKGLTSSYETWASRNK
jgi:hypothetical protein